MTDEEKIKLASQIAINFGIDFMDAKCRVEQACMNFGKEFNMSTETSDKNVASEEDIKILENLKSYLNLLVYEGKDKIIYNDLLWDEKTVDCINAIEHLINDYTRQEQINEEHQKINGELREKVKELEEGNIQKDLEIIGTKEYAEANMKEIIEKYYTANEDCILKQKVKQGLEDIEDYFDRLNGPDEDIEYIRHVKQEILEGESK